MRKLVTRRSLLVGGVAAGAALASVAGLRLGPVKTGWKVLSSEEVDIVQAIAEIMFPAGRMPMNGVEAGVAREVDDILDRNLLPMHARVVRYVLRTLEWGTWISRGTRFSDLPPAERAEVFAAWQEPHVLPRRVAADGLRAVLGAAYFRNRDVLKHIGYRSLCSSGRRR